MTELTIFTPVYNRKLELIRLYDSLCQQTNLNFIWLIVDDGSTINLKNTISEFIKTAPFKIEYHYQINQGKHCAFNKAIDKVDTSYLMCVDSDDILSKNAVQLIYDNIPLVEQEKLIGIISPRNKKLDLKTNKKFVKLVEIIASFNKPVELAIIHKTSVLKKFSFPVFKHEKFFSEEYLYNKLDNIGNYLYVPTPFYYFEYLEGGLTKTINQNWVNSPNATYLLFKSRFYSF